MSEGLVALLNVINAGGVVAVLVMLVLMFYRGDILPRRVYEDLTQRLLGEMCKRVLEGVEELIGEER